jgi:arylformamidase
MAASPAFAEECRIGPPPHQKGPLVWMDMDQVELDAAYDQAFYAPLAPQFMKRRASNSEIARSRVGQPRREAYGPRGRIEGHAYGGPLPETSNNPVKHGSR